MGETLVARPANHTRSGLSPKALGSLDFSRRHPKAGEVQTLGHRGWRHLPILCSQPNSLLYSWLPGEKGVPAGRTWASGPGAVWTCEEVTLLGLHCGFVLHS
jgi:hypothetical protein